jgi:hypothetical protein
MLLSTDAAAFPFADRSKQIQRCLLTKHNTLFFIETEEEVKILTIFDTRQDPEKLSIIF